MLVRYLRTEPVHLVVTAGNTHEFGAENLCSENLRLFEIGGNEDPTFKSMPRGLCCGGVGEITGRRAGDGIEAEGAGIGQRDRDHTVFETECGRADRIILDEDAFRAEPAPEFR